MFRTIEDIRASNSNFFAPVTLAHWNSRVSSVVHPDKNGGAYFVTSEKFDSGYKRKYTVRYCAPNGRIRTIGEFLGFDTLRAAHKRAEDFVTGKRILPCGVCGLPIARVTEGETVLKWCSDQWHTGC